MNKFSKPFAAVALAMAIPAAFANSGSVWVGGEAGFAPHASQSQDNAALPSAHQHRYVDVGRERVRTHVDDRVSSQVNRQGDESNRMRAMGNSGQAPAWPGAQDLMGGPN